MSLDPQVEALLAQMQEQGVKSFEQMSVPEAREVIQLFGQLQGEAEEVAEVTDRTIPGPGGDLKVRIYRPEGDGPLPVLVYFHGGGFVVGDIEVADKPCRQMANGAGCVVVSVDYRLAPEHPYPAAVEDSWAATVWAAEHASEFGGDGSRLAVGGDSAGGNLAAVVALKARDAGGPRIGLQVLLYPVTDLVNERPSRVENAEGYLLTTAAMEWFGGHYLADPAQAGEPMASPLLADDLSGVAPAIVVTAGHDPLRDEGDAYAEALEQAGVPVRHERNPSMIHGFLWLGGVVEHTAGAYRVIGEHMRSSLAVAA